MIMELNIEYHVILINVFKYLTYYPKRILHIYSIFNICP